MILDQEHRQRRIHPFADQLQAEAFRQISGADPCGLHSLHVQQRFPDELHVRAGLLGDLFQADAEISVLVQAAGEIERHRKDLASQSGKLQFGSQRFRKRHAASRGDLPVLVLRVLVRLDRFVGNAAGILRPVDSFRFFRAFAFVHFQHGIGEKLFLHVLFELHGVQLQHVDRLQKARRERQFLALFDCQLIALFHSFIISQSAVDLNGSLRGLPFFAERFQTPAQACGYDVAADVQRFGQLRRRPAQKPAVIDGLLLVRRQFLQDLQQHPHRFRLHRGILRAEAGWQKILRWQRFERMSASVVNKMLRNRKQPTLRILRIVQLFELFPGFAERSVRRLVRFCRVAGERLTEAEQFVSERIDMLQIEVLSFLQRKKNGLFTAS